MIKRRLDEPLDLCQINNLMMNVTNQLVKTFKRRKAYSSFKDNIWDANLADMKLISKFNKKTRLLFCVIDIFSKYAWVFSLKYKKVQLLPMHFKKLETIERNYIKKENQIKHV